MPFRCLSHVHTRRSFDSFLSPKKIVARAQQLGIGALIVTDHNTIQGSLDVREAVAGDSPLVITAAEYQSEKGDIIGLFLQEEIRSRRSAEIVEQIHAQGGLVLLPHPHKAHNLDDNLLSQVDLVETYNGRCSDGENARAQELARTLNLPGLAGADAHCSFELASAVNEFLVDSPTDTGALRRHLLHADRRPITRRAPGFCRPYSQMVKAFKTKNPSLLVYQARRLALALAHVKEQ